MMAVGRFFLDFELFRAESGPSLRVREHGRGDGVFATARRGDAVDPAARDLRRRRRREAEAILVCCYARISLTKLAAVGCEAFVH